MKIGILGVGSIGTILAQRLSVAGHDVIVANSRGPETVSADALLHGARAVEAREVSAGVDVLILSVPLNSMPAIRTVVESAPSEAVLIDTSNYYPHRDQQITLLNEGMTESEWVVEQIGRPLVKAWNAIASAPFETAATETGMRIAIPVAGDSAPAKAVAMRLVEETSLDAVDAGSLAESWRQQPGTPVYCTVRTADEVPALLERADRLASPRRRDLVIAAIQDRIQSDGDVTGEYITRVNRAIY